MITGVVTSDRQAVVRFPVCGPRGREGEVEAVVDTGFTGFLTLSTDLVSALGLPFAGTVRASMADGSVVAMDAYEATVRWDSQVLDVVALEAHGIALVGMALLSGCRVTIDAVDGGSVRIDQLP